MESLGISVTRNVGVNGVVGILEGNKKGKVVGLRADMDALPIKEKNYLPFMSINDGVMHAVVMIVTWLFSWGQQKYYPIIEILKVL